MSEAENRRELDGLKSKRNEAVFHLLMTQQQQNGTETFIPAISQAVIIELSDYIERLNIRIEGLEYMFVADDVQHYVQEAFLFLYDCAINDDEIPF